MTTTIIVCTKDRAGELRNTLDALRNVKVPTGLQVNLIIVDNGSTDSTRPLVRETRIEGMSVHYLLEPRRGQVMARNSGISASNGEIIAFLDDDVRPETQWLTELVAPLAEGKCDVAVGAIRIAPHLLRDWMTDFHRTYLAANSTTGGSEPSFATGANFAFCRLVLDRVPSFDSELGPGRLGFWDDSLFSLQLKEAGYRFLNAPRAVVDHHFLPGRLLRGSFLNRATAEGRSRAYIAWHWDHFPPFPRPRLHAIRKRFRLALLRKLRRSECISLEGASEWEMNLVSQVGYFSQLVLEQRRPRSYEKRGLRKMGT